MRYTTKRNGKNVIPLLKAVCGLNLPYWRIDRADDLHSYLSGDAADKLAAYEATGFEPYEIDFCLSGAISPQEAKEWYEAHKKRYDEWFAWKQAEEQGRLVILPCKVGDTLFLAQVGREEPFSMRVQGMSISASGNDVILHFGGFPITNAWGSEVGKTLYLTREEAEAVLKGESRNGKKHE